MGVDGHFPMNNRTPLRRRRNLLFYYLRGFLRSRPQSLSTAAVFRWHAPLILALRKCGASEAHVGRKEKRSESRFAARRVRELLPQNIPRIESVQVCPVRTSF